MQDYRPNAQILRDLTTRNVVVVVGPSAAGKTTIMGQAVQQDPSAHFVVSTTSRAMRPGEQNGRDYHFRPRHEVERHIKRQAYVNLTHGPTGDYYATNLADYEAGSINILAVWASVIPYFRSLPFKSFKVIFIVPPTFETWKERLLERGWDADVLQKRLLEIKESLRFALDNPCELILNDDLRQAVNDFLVAAHRADDTAIPSQTAIKQHVGQLLQDVERFLSQKA
jgi:guanylate kinase